MNSNLKQAREFCFQYLFHLQLPIFESLKSELQNSATSELLENSIAEFKQTTNNLFEDGMNQIVLKRIQGILTNYDNLEEIISDHLKNWKISRIAKVDHTTLLLATYELHFETDTPAKVIMNEAIEISKKFGSEESPSFINGVLDKISKEFIQNKRSVKIGRGLL